MDFEYPAHFQAGVKYKVLIDLQVNFDVGWTDYKAWDKFKFNVGSPNFSITAKLLSANIGDASLALPLEFTSPWNLASVWNTSDRSFEVT